MSNKASFALLILVTSARLLGGLIVVKTLSSLFGPEQFGTLTQVMGIAAIFFMFAGGGVTNGLIKTVAESSSEGRAGWLQAAFAICAGSSLLLAIIAVLISQVALDAIFPNGPVPPVLFAIAAAQALVGFGNVMLAYLSGMGDVRAFALVSIGGSVIGTIGTILLAWLFGFTGAAYGLAVFPVAPGAIALALFLRRTSGRGLAFRPAMANVHVLLRYSFAMAPAVLAVPLAQVLIRADLGQREGWRVVGNWQAVAKISDAYMQVFGVLFINLLLPQLARCAKPAESINVLRRFGVWLLVLFLAGALPLYLMRDLVISLAYSPDFLPATSFLLFQLIADFARISAFIFLYYFLAQGRLWLTTASEVFQATAIYLIYLALWPVNGAMAAIYNQIATYAMLLFALASLLIYSRWNRATEDANPHALH